MTRGIRWSSSGAALLVVALAAGLVGCVSSAESDVRAALSPLVQQAQDWAWPARAALAGDPDAIIGVTPWIADLRNPGPPPASGLYVIDTSTVGGGSRVDLAVATSFSTQIGWSMGNGAGITCFSLDIPATGDRIEMADLDCPARATALLADAKEVSVGSLGLPSILDASNMPPDPPEALSQSAHVRLLTALREETTADAVDARLRGLLTQSNIVISVDGQDGEIAAAVGAAGTGDCLLAVRQRDGTVTEPPFDPIWAEPGETGCSSDLYFAPPL